MANVLYNEYCDSDEVTSEISLMKESLTIDKLVLAYNTLMEQEELNLREAELNCMMESGDMNTLAQFYEDVTEEVKEKKDNIFKRIWDAICKFFRSLKEAITGSKQMKQLDEDAKNNKEYGVDEDAEKSFKLLKTLKEKVGKPSMDALKKFTEQSVWKILLEILGVGLTGGAVALTVHNCKKVKAGEIHGIRDWAAEWSNVFTEGLSNKAQEIKSNLTDDDGHPIVIQVIIQKVKDLASKIMTWVKKIIPIGKGDNDDSEDNENQENKITRTLADLTNEERAKYNKKIAKANAKCGSDTKKFAKKVKAIKNEFGLSTESVIESLDAIGIFLEASDLDSYDDSYISEAYDDDPFELDDMFAESSSTDIDDVYDLLGTL